MVPKISCSVRFGLQQESRRHFKTVNGDTVNKWSPYYHLYRFAGGLSSQASLSAAYSSKLAAVHQLLPTLKDAQSAWAGWLAETASAPKCCGGDEKDNLSDDSASRLRFRGQLFNMFSKLPLQAQYCWSALWSCLNAMDRRFIWNTIGVLKIFDLEYSAFNLQLKLLSGLAKKYQEMLFGKQWKLLVDLHTVRDYLPTKDITDFVDDIRDWVTGEAPHTLKGSEAYFLQLLGDGVTKYLETLSLIHI